jgi:hypothetical protein
MEEKVKEKNGEGRNGVKEKGKRGKGKGGMGKEEGERRKGEHAATFHFTYITSRVGPRVLYLACPAMLSPLFNEITLF